MTQQRTEATVEESRPERSGVTRRPLLKALGIGTALSAASGVAAGHPGDESGSQQTNGGAEIDPLYGFPTPAVEDIPAGLDPDHEVTLHTLQPADPEDPDRPILFYFEPAGLRVEAGDVVQFTMQSPDHTITAYHPANGFQRRVPADVPPFSSPVLGAGGAWLYRFDREGLYDLYCSPHHVFGMAMRIVVGEMSEGDVPAFEGTFEGSADPPLLPPFGKASLEHELNAPSEHNQDCEWPYLTPQEVLDAPSLDPSTIQERGSVPFADVLGDIDRMPDQLEEGADEEETADGDETGDTSAATVQVREHDELGDILVDARGMTLYLFVPDEAETGSTCHGPCAASWPPLTTTDEPVAGDDVTAELATFERRDSGELQVAANDWPLYTFVEDESPGDANGQGIDDVWWTLNPDGTATRSPDR